MDTQISPIATIAGTLVPFIVEFVKTSPMFSSFSEDTKTRLSALSFALSATAALIASINDGTLDNDTLTDFVNAFGTVIATFGVSEMVYQKLVKPLKKAVNQA